MKKQFSILALAMMMSLTATAKPHKQNDPTSTIPDFSWAIAAQIYAKSTPDLDVKEHIPTYLYGVHNDELKKLKGDQFAIKEFDDKAESIFANDMKTFQGTDKTYKMTVENRIYVKDYDFEKKQLNVKFAQGVIGVPEGLRWYVNAEHPLVENNQDLEFPDLYTVVADNPEVMDCFSMDKEQAKAFLEKTKGTFSYYAIEFKVVSVEPANPSAEDTESKLNGKVTIHISNVHYMKDTDRYDFTCPLPTSNTATGVAAAN